MITLLTLPIYLAYDQTSLAKSGDGFDEPVNVSGAQAPTVLLGAFFMPKRSSFGSAHWEAFGPAGDLSSRFVNPMRAATIIFDEIWCQLIINHAQDTNMSHSIIAVREDATPSQLADFIRDTSFQAQAVSRAITQCLECKSDFAINFDQVSYLQWILSDILRLQSAACEQLEALS